MENIRLSLCMIVKDEEEFIRACLNSVKDVVDEMVIVDTGSTDNTIEICQSFGAQVEKFKWNGSFADARNYGIDKAKGDWILWLDADEEVDKIDRYLLKERSYFKDYDALTIHLVNYYGKEIDKSNTTDVAHTRLFRRKSGIKFINKIHETLDTRRLPPEKIGHLKAKIHHYGYLDSIVEKKDKYDRNMKMLKQQLEEGENVQWVHYYIAMEHYRKQQFKMAYERANLSIKAFLEIRQLPPSMIYKLKYSALIALGSFEGAWPGIERAIALYPDYVDLRFFKGIILYYLEKYELSLQSFEECIEMGEDNINHLVLTGVGSFQAWYYKGLCQQKLEKKEEAINSFLQSLAISPHYQPALDSITSIVNEDKVDLRKHMKEGLKEGEYKVLIDKLKNKKLI